MSRRVVFLDRDGTLIVDPGYLRDPEAVQLLPGAIAALRDLEQAGWARVVISNQSGIGRGLYRLEDFLAVERRVEELLAAGGASIDLMLWCPHAPEAGCPCRKPGTALHREAIARLDLVAEGCWCVGDRPSDLAPATSLGGSAILVRTGQGSRHAAEAAGLGAAVVEGIAQAAERIIATTPP